MSADLALQDAIIARLEQTAALIALVPSANILDRNARPAPDPSIVVGESQSLPGDDIARKQQRVVATIHIWKKELSLVGAKRIGGAIRTAIGAGRPLLGEGFHCGDWYVADARYLRDPDGVTSHGIVRIEALVLETT